MSNLIVPNPSRTAPAFLVLAVAMWSGNFVAGRWLGGSVDALGLNVWRWLLALAILLPLALPELARHRAAIVSSWRHLALLGLTGVAGFHFFVYKALAHTAATNALLMLSTAPALIAVLSFLVGGEPLRGRQWLGIGISFIGAAILITRGDLAALASLQFGQGELWMLAAVPTWSAYSVLLKYRPAALPQRTTLTVSTVFGLAFMALPAWFHPEALRVDWTPGVLAGIAYIAVGASVLAFLGWNRGVALVGPARAGVYLHLMPLFGAVLAWLLLGERLYAWHLAGAVFVFAGIIATQSRRVTPSALPGRCAATG